MTTTTKQAAAGPKKDPPARATDQPTAALARSFTEQRRTILTRDVFLRSQGPAVVPVHLPGLDVVVLMKRLDLLDLARRGADYMPFRSAILAMISEGGIKTEQVRADGIADTLDLAARVALDAIVVTPPEIAHALADAMDRDDEALAPQIEAWQDELNQARKAQDTARLAALGLSRPRVAMTHQLEVLRRVDARSLRPLFVAPGEEPDDDQIVLAYALPDDDGGFLAGDGDGGIPAADLVVILRSAHQYGPGAMGRTFRGQ